MWLVRLYRRQYQGVGFVDGGGVEAGEIYLCGGLGVVSHAFAYDAEGDAFAFGRRSPAMARHVECQGDGDSCHLRYGFQAAVDVVAGIAVSVAFVRAGITDYKQQIA